MKISEIVARLERDGWLLLRTKGSHRQFKHPAKRGLVTVAGKMSDEPPPKTLASIFKQAGWNKQ